MPLAVFCPYFFGLRARDADRTNQVEMIFRTLNSIIKYATYESRNHLFFTSSQPKKHHYIFKFGPVLFEI
ncbi:MAG: hypothetical protein KAJ60_06970, partial [Desulfobulbaceae bacterium]|nr:hypothetical protein [Desulfobulbaceae bacterium]